MSDLHEHTDNQEFLYVFYIAFQSLRRLSWVFFSCADSEFNQRANHCGGNKYNEPIRTRIENMSLISGKRGKNA